jgi:hypothetical protein
MDHKEPGLGDSVLVEDEPLVVSVTLTDGLTVVNTGHLY